MSWIVSIPVSMVFGYFAGKAIRKGETRNATLIVTSFAILYTGYLVLLLRGIL